MKTTKTTKEKALDFANQSKVERKKGYSKLPYDVQMEVRSIIEARRGVMHVNGKLKFTDKELARQIAHLGAKRDRFIAGVPILDKKISDLETELAQRNEA